MTENSRKKTVVVCDTQPITAEGLRNLLASSPNLEFLGTVSSLEAAMECVRSKSPDLMILDKGFGMRAVLDWIHELKLSDASPAVTVWGVSMTEAEALRLLQAGARGIVRKTADLGSLMTCLENVAAGRSWMEECVFRESARQDGYPRSELTPREHQVLGIGGAGLQEQGDRPRARHQSRNGEDPSRSTSSKKPVCAAATDWRSTA